MIKNVWFVFALLFIVVWCPAAVFSETISLHADEWCPYNCQPGAEKPGYMVEIAQSIFRPLGHMIDYETTNWSRSIMLARAGRIHGIIGASKSETPDLVFPDIETGYAGGAFFIRRGFGWRYAGDKSLDDVALAVIQDYGYGRLDDYIETHRNTPRVITTAGENALELNIKMLLKGRVDVVLETEAVFRNTASEMGVMDRLEFAGSDGETGEPNFIYIAFAPNNPDSLRYAKQLSRGIRELRKSGQLADILKKYGLKDWRSE
jgi:polar amino acid transport system substrate-binding protein